MNGIKKQRGHKRYYQSLFSKQDFKKETWVDFDNPKTWEHNWHIHFDPWGFGNNSFKRSTLR